ncbi:MAG: TetR/AcrR family transcriptional regulator [Alphaproteobacteria bacterium]|nr:TetR/AcrR family transcriptional regulator [Alphaproteobacteria bacterium]
MTDAKMSGVKPRKQPKQNRSRQMQADILEAAIRVLQQDGLAAFTTVRVAEVTGISVGSLYQYYPNKNSILFDLQRRIMEQAWGQVSAIMHDETLRGRVKICKINDLFFRAEAIEVRQMGEAIHDAEIVDAKAQEFAEIDDQVLVLFADFLALNGSLDAKGDAAFLVGTLDSMGHYCAA